MVVVGFNFTKMEIERKNPVKGKVKITNNVAIKKVELQDLALGNTKQQGLKVTFEFITKYETNIGEIKLIGDLVFMSEEKKLKEVADQWKKDKSVPKDVMTHILNNILNKCNVQALIMSQQMNLPAPIPLPKVNVGEAKK
ncbi:MAG: hypothetical protein KAS15_05095 [Nanoarchaeota archaeon]|nr:hypothetical protein [Nanoarchaeota archaeon]MCK5630767.1 hypothetical protein [Nanoarchaeota archaeon]